VSVEFASDDQLRGVVAHADFGHVAQAQTLGAGMNIGMVILDQIIPDSGYITPLVADSGVMRRFSRKEEYEADAHGVEILKRAKYDGKQATGDKIDDVSITGLAKMTLLIHRSTSALNTSVTTKNGVVTLTGKAKNTAEKELATKYVNGVKSVKNLMTID
jgi:hypothetical protein